MRTPVTRKDAIIATQTRTLRDVQETSPSQDGYLEQAVKMVPVESVGLFVFFDGLLKANQAMPQIGAYAWLLFGIVLILSPFFVLYNWKKDQQNEKERTARLPFPADKIAIAPIAFIVWVLALGGPFSTLGWYSPLLGSVILAVFASTAPRIVDLLPKGKPTG